MSILTDAWLEEENKLRKENKRLRKALIDLMKVEPSDAWWLRDNYCRARDQARNILKKTKES